MPTDKQAEYKRGYDAGRRLALRDRRHQVMCAALTGLLANPVPPTLRGGAVKTLAGILDVAAALADDWENRHGGK